MVSGVRLLCNRPLVIRSTPAGLNSRSLAKRWPTRSAWVTVWTKTIAWIPGFITNCWEERRGNGGQCREVQVQSSSLWGMFQSRSYYNWGNRAGLGGIRLHAVPFFSLSIWETGASEMHDRARDWSERDRWPRGEWGRGAAVPLTRSSLSITERKERDCVLSRRGCERMTQSVGWIERWGARLKCPR